MKLKALSRKLTLKYAIAPTMPSAPGPNMNVQVPKAPKVPIIEEYSAPLSDQEGMLPESDYEVKTPILHPEPGVVPESNGVTPTLRPDQMIAMPEWKHKLISAVNVIGRVSVITPIYQHDLMQKINRSTDDSVSEFELKQEITKLITDAEKNAADFLHKMKRTLHSLR